MSFREWGDERSSYLLPKWGTVLPWFGEWLPSWKYPWVPSPGSDFSMKDGSQTILSVKTPWEISLKPYSRHSGLLWPLFVFIMWMLWIMLLIIFIFCIWLEEAWSQMEGLLWHEEWSIMCVWVWSWNWVVPCRVPGHGGLFVSRFL